ncbi:MAG: hypothetical protein J1D77_03070 [Muribaculaceae bacterium]|nr:hypothetical protein [Muribaculaceae bacterium]
MKNILRLILIIFFCGILFGLPSCSDEPEIKTDDYTENVSKEDSVISPSDEDKTNDGEDTINPDGSAEEPESVCPDFYEVIEGNEDDFIFPALKSPVVTTLLKDLTIYDEINHRTWDYNVALPPSFYEDEEKVYPVLYILHGLGSDNNDATYAFRISYLLDYFYEKKLLPEIVVVIPSGERCYWVDDYEEGVEYESFFFNIFMPQVEETYRIDKTLKRFITGFSMGGYGAAHYAFTYPEVFGYCYSMSGTLMGKNTASTPAVPTTIKANINSSLPYFTMDIGTEDAFLSVNNTVDLLLRVLEIPHEFIVREGSHTADFWRSGINACLLRIGRCLDNTLLIEQKFRIYEE